MDKSWNCAYCGKQGGEIVYQGVKAQAMYCSQSCTDKADKYEEDRCSLIQQYNQDSYDLIRDNARDRADAQAAWMGIEKEDKS